MTSIALALYFLGPFFLLRLNKRWGVLLAILWLWLPIEFGLFRSVTAVVIGMASGVLAFRSRRDVMDVSSAFDIRKFEPARALVHFAIFAAIAIPLGLWIGFLSLHFTLPSLAMVGAILFFNALPEEILFRGVIQHTIESRLRNRTVALLIAAVIFGAAHLNNGPVVPNYKYFLMASIAGVFYGNAWRGRKNVLTSTLTHALVNTGWAMFLR